MLRQYYDSQIKLIEQKISEIDQNILEYKKQIDHYSSQNGISFTPRSHGNEEFDNTEDDLTVIRWREKIRVAEVRKTTLIQDLTIMKEKINNEELDYDDLFEYDTYDDDTFGNDSIDDVSSMEENGMASDGGCLGHDYLEIDPQNNNYFSKDDEVKKNAIDKNQPFLSEYSKFLKEELGKVNTVMTIFSSNRNKAKILLKEIKNDLETKIRDLDS